MSFINRRTKAQFYNDSSITFFVQKDCVDIIFKVKRGIYLTVSVYSLSGDRLLLACLWDGFWNRLRHMNNRKDVISRLEKTCPLTSGIFTNASSTHFAYIDKEREIGHKIGTALKHGNLDVDVMQNEKGEYCVLELNPRFGGGFPFSYEAGVNLPKAIIEWVKGNKVDASMLQPEYGRMFSKNDYLMEIK